MKLSLVGISHRHAPVELRERVALGAKEASALAKELAREGGECVCLSTCNRTELYTAGDGVQVLAYVPHDDLPALYAGALALTLPSRFEGFGFPVLEAMRCGTAVLASDAGALPEIVGSAGILLSPDDPGSWSQAMIELAHDVELQRRLISAGEARSAAFTWERAAEQIWRVLDAASRPHPGGQAAIASR